MAGYVNGPQAAEWGRQRLDIEGEWPPVLVDLDLRYWADPKACDYQKRPSIRLLAAAWGWHRRRVERRLKRDTTGTLPGQKGDNGGTVDPVSKTTIQPDRDTTGTLPGQKGDNGGTAPLYKRARASPSPDPTPAQEQTPKPPRGLLQILSALRGSDIDKANQKTIAEFRMFRKKTSATVPQMLLIVAAMKHCPQQIFARDVRAETWPDGTDRSTFWGTLIVQRRWSDRLSVAEKWDREGRPGAKARKRQSAFEYDQPAEPQTSFDLQCEKAFANGGIEALDALIAAQQ